VIIPTYEEAANITLLVTGISKCLQEDYKDDFEIIIVDDNSHDNTVIICQNLAVNYPNLKLITRTEERGLASAILRGINESKGEIIITMDADLSHDPLMIPQLINEITTNGADIVIASRFMNGHSMYSSKRLVLGSKILNGFIRNLLILPAKDVTGGYHAIKRSVFTSINTVSTFQGYGDYSFALLYKSIKKHKVISEVAFVYKPRQYGVSKTRFLKSGIRYGIRALKLRLGLE
jgi:dolichol-phosphate mannosyltransferase